MTEEAITKVEAEKNAVIAEKDAEIIELKKRIAELSASQGVPEK